MSSTYASVLGRVKSVTIEAMVHKRIYFDYRSFDKPMLEGIISCEIEKLSYYMSEEIIRRVCQVMFKLYAPIKASSFKEI